MSEMVVPKSSHDRSCPKGSTTEQHMTCTRSTDPILVYVDALLATCTMFAIVPFGDETAACSNCQESFTRNTGCCIEVFRLPFNKNIARLLMNMLGPNQFQPIFSRHDSPWENAW